MDKLQILDSFHLRATLWVMLIDIAEFMFARPFGQTETSSDMLFAKLFHLVFLVLSSIRKARNDGRDTTG